MPPTTQAQGPVFVSSQVAKSVFQWKDAIAALQEAYTQPSSPSATPPRAIASAGKAWLRTLSAIPTGGRYFGAKVMGANMELSPMNVEYVIVLFDRTTSRIAAFIDGKLVTGYRTAATSAAALDKLAPRKAARLAVIGSGLEASMHTRAFANVRDLTEIVVYSPTLERRDSFALEAERDLGIPSRSVDSAKRAVEGADIVLTAARSRDETPILFGDWLKQGATLVSIGSTIPQQREIDTSVIERSDLIVCDMLEEVLEETGDMLAAKAAGIQVDDKSFSLSELMSGACENRLKEANAPLYKSVGGGLQDIVIAELILNKAQEAGLATPLPINFETKN